MLCYREEYFFFIFIQAVDRRPARRGPRLRHPEALHPREALRLHPQDRARRDEGPHLPVQDLQGVLRTGLKAGQRVPSVPVSQVRIKEESFF